jgi:hypothetical protein
MPAKMIHPLLIFALPYGSIMSFPLLVGPFDVGVSVCCHDILVRMRIQLADKSSVESCARISAGASSKSQQADSRDQEEQS